MSESLGPQQESEQGQEPEQKQKEKEIFVQNGLKAYALPEFGKQNPEVGWKSIVPPSPEEAQEQLNDLLASIKKQGGQLIACVDINVAIPEEPGVMRDPIASETKTFMIIQKQH